MVAGVFFGKQYGVLDYAAVLLLCVGLVCFTLADAAAASAAVSAFGVTLMATSTVADAVRLNLSETLMDANGYGRSVNELLFVSETMGAVLALPLTLFNGEWWRALAYFPAHHDVLWQLLLMGVLAFFGGVCQMQLVHLTNAFYVSLFGIGRMVLTIAASFVVFRKTVSPMHVLGASMFVLGLVLRSWASKLPVKSKR
jgi:drug/metabolite transporter (DMT)-like permease